MEILSSIKEFLLKPFTDNLPIFLCTWVLASAADTYFWSIHGDPVFGVYMCLHGFIVCYFTILVYSLLRGVPAKVFKVVLLILGYVNLAMDAMVHSVMYFSFTGDVVAIIMGSNPSEAAEFLPMYLTSSVVWFIVIASAISVAFLLFAGKLVPFAKKWAAYCAFVLLIAGLTVVIVRKSNNWEGVFLNKILLFTSYDSPVDLRQYSSEPEVNVVGIQPEDIVLVIGESLSKSHCSLYGYCKDTQPELDSLRAKGEIVCFDSVEAPFPNTVESFKSMMSTYRSSCPSEEWYSCNTFLLDAVKAAGYKTYWISNQSSVGLYDNIVAKFAELADSTIWVGTKGMGIGKHDFDELVLPVVESIAAGEDRKFLVVHLMGSHEGFSSRYPEDYAIFNSDDYKDYPENQRQLLSEYDNSILYNDHVVASIFHMFDLESDFVAYFPDHGLDIFETDPEYAGHARPSEPDSYKAGVSIPFIVSAYAASKTNLSEAFNTEDLFGFVMDAAEAEIVK